MEKNKVTQKELSKILGLSEAVLRVHLACFEKYKIPRTRPFQYFYNYSFLLALKKFYVAKSECMNKHYEQYEKVVAKLDKIIKLWKKKLELTSVSSEKL